MRRNSPDQLNGRDNHRAPSAPPLKRPEKHGFDRPNNPCAITEQHAKRPLPSASGVKKEAPPRLGRETFVTMMQAADLWESDDLARIGRMNQTWFRAVLLKRQVSPGSMVIVEVG